MRYSPGKTFGSQAPPKVYSGAEECIDGPCVTKQWHDRRADDTPRAVQRLRSQTPQYLGPDGDHRDEQRQRGERSGFLD